MESKFEGFGMEAGSFVETFKLTAGLFHGTEFRGVPGGRVGEWDAGSFPGG